MYAFIQLLSKDVVFVDSLSLYLEYHRNIYMVWEPPRERDPNRNPNFIFPLALSKKTPAVTIQSTPSEQSLSVCPQHFVYGDSPRWCQLKLNSLGDSSKCCHRLYTVTSQARLQPQPLPLVVVDTYWQGESRCSLLLISLPHLSSSVVNHEPSSLLTFIS